MFSHISLLIQREKTEGSWVTGKIFVGDIMVKEHIRKSLKSHIYYMYVYYMYVYNVKKKMCVPLS